MDTGTLLNALLVVVFVLVGGVFSATEMALVSLRESQLEQMDKTSRRARTAATLARDSGTFLSAVQIGVTFAGFLSSAYGAATLAPSLAPVLTRLGLPGGAADATALVVMTLLVSYLSLVLGELVPKRMAIQTPRQIATATGPPLARFATVMRPVIWLLNLSTSALLRLFGYDPKRSAEAMSDEEVRSIVTSHGGFHAEERLLLKEVFDASDRSVQEIMRHRTDIVGFPAGMPVADAVAQVAGGQYSRFPVYSGSIDDVVGMVHVRDLLSAVASPSARVRVVRDLVRPIVFVPGTSPILPTMNLLRRRGQHMAIVVDEYGGTDGLVTLEDMIEEVVGEIYDEYDVRDAATLGLREERLLTGDLNLEDFQQRTGVALADGPYETVAGWIMARLGRVAKVGDRVEIAPEQTQDGDDDGAEPLARYELEVAEVERHRIRGVRLRKLPAAGPVRPRPRDPAPNG